MPTASRSSSFNLACVVLAGCDAMLLVSPRLAVSDNNCKAFRNFLPPSIPEAISKHTIPPPALICLLAISYWGCEGRKGYRTLESFGCPSSFPAIYRALEQCLSMRTSNVSMLLLNIHALKGDKAGPAFLQNR